MGSKKLQRRLLERARTFNVISPLTWAPEDELSPSTSERKTAANSRETPSAEHQIPGTRDLERHDELLLWNQRQSPPPEATSRDASMAVARSSSPLLASGEQDPFIAATAGSGPQQQRNQRQQFISSSAASDHETSTVFVQPQEQDTAATRPGKLPMKTKKLLERRKTFDTDMGPTSTTKSMRSSEIDIGMPASKAVSPAHPPLPDISSTKIDDHHHHHHHLYGGNADQPSLRSARESDARSERTRTHTVATRSDPLRRRLGENDLREELKEQPLPFEFDSLGEHEIRLITVAPSANLNDPLECLVTKSARDESPGYSAISYTWGNVNANASISCNERLLQVPRSCEEVLKAVRHPFEEQTFWVDAVCINQGDLEERKVQVANMGDVYRLANETLIYLGPTDKRWNLFDESIKTADWMGVFQRPWFERTWVIQELMLSRAVTAVIGSQKLPWLGLLALCEARGIRLPRIIDLRNEFVHDYGRRPPKSDDYFAVGRELIMDSLEDDDVVSGSGSAKGTWQSTGCFVNEVTDEPEALPLRTMAATAISSTEEAHRSNRQNSQKEPEAVTKGSGHVNLNYWRLLDIMERTHPFKCKDARDKLFALLPLFCRPIPKLLYPDYSKSSVEVYTDLAWYFLQDELSNALRNASCTHSFNVPSWVTDWAKPLATGGGRKVFERYENGRTGFKPGTREIRARREGRTGELVVLRGLKVGKITKTEHAAFFGFLSPRLAHSVEAKVVATDPSRSNGHHGQLKVKWKVTQRLGLELLEGDEGWRVAANVLFEQIETALAEADQIRSPPVTSEGSKRRVQEVAIHDAHTAEALAISVIDAYLAGLEVAPPPDLRVVGFTTPRSSFSNYFFQCRADRTLSNLNVERKYNGECLWAVEPRDHLVILLGFELPFIMRENGDKAQLVGECQLSDGAVMQGALVENLDWDRVWSKPCEHPLADFTIF